MTAKPSTKTTQKLALSPGWAAFLEFLLVEQEARREEQESRQEQEGTKTVKNERSCE